jgi:putative acetyltransferase
MRRDHCWLGLSFVAEPRDRPGEVVGHVAYTRAWLDAPTGPVDVLNLSPLSVSPPWQRQGVGSRLVRRTLEFLRARTEPLVFLEGDPAYYGRLGFRPAGEAGFLRPSVRIPEAGFQVHRLHPHAADVSGALVYPDVFWRHGAVGPSAGEGHE